MRTGDKVMSKLSTLFLLCVLALNGNIVEAQKRFPKKTSIPKIARMLGVQVGFNGQHALRRTLSYGKIATGGHPNSRQMWRIRSPKSEVVTDGFNTTYEGYMIESLDWGMLEVPDVSGPDVPMVKRLPRGSGWMGTIYPGMTKRQVERLIAGRLPPPKKKGEMWEWTQQGYYRLGNDLYFEWVATLSFQRDRLKDIGVWVDYKYVQ